MLEKREEAEVSKTSVPQGPNGMVKAPLPEVQSWLVVVPSVWCWYNHSDDGSVDYI